MALYRFSVRTHSKAAIGSIVEGAAYRAGENLRDHINDTTHHYSRKQGVVQTEILAPANAPDWVHQREDLWNEVQASAKRVDARFAREIIIALPRELNHEQNWKLVAGFVEGECVPRGMIADIAFHDTPAADGERNPHAHVVLTTREISPEGFGKVNRDWNNRGLVRHWRVAWEEHANAALENAGSDARINHRSIEEQEVEKLYAEAMLSQVQTTPAQRAADRRERSEAHNLRAPPDRESADAPLWQSDLTQIHELVMPTDAHQLVEKSTGAEQLPEDVPLANHVREGQHIGRAALAMEQRGIQTRQGDWLRAIQQRNAIRSHLASITRHTIKAVGRQVARLDATGFAGQTLRAATQRLHRIQGWLSRVRPDLALQSSNTTLRQKGPRQ